MGIYKTYFDKNNTIIKNSLVNTGKNPVSELYCGDKISRFLFHCDFSNLINMVEDKVFDVRNLRHILKIKNTSDFDIRGNLSLSNDIQIGYTERTTSCDIEVRPLTQLWDEGTGYDFNSIYMLGDNNYKVEASNWVNATVARQFTNPGAINTDLILGTQHLDNGNEDINIDITDFVNSIITDNISFDDLDDNKIDEFFGFCLKYSDESENNFSGVTKTLGLYTKYTQTFYEPFIETIWDDAILDDRVNFYPNKQNKLFLYVNINGNLTNLDRLPSCEIDDVEYTVTQHTTGVYYITIPADTVFETYTEYHDIWSKLALNGVALDNVTLKFIPLDNKPYYNIGAKSVEPVKYGISLSGIKFGETLDQGNMRRVNVLLRKPYTLNDYEFIDNLFYRVYVKQGKNLVEVMNWQRVSKSYDNHYFMIDTSWMIPQTYYLDIKTVLGGEVNIYNEQLKFTINNKIIY